VSLEAVVGGRWSVVSGQSLKTTIMHSVVARRSERREVPRSESGGEARTEVAIPSDSLVPCEGMRWPRPVALSLPKGSGARHDVQTNG
jgi:hypothetical protein